MATHSSILAWEIPGTEVPGGLQSMGLQRVRHNRVTEHIHTCGILVLKPGIECTFPAREGRFLTTGQLSII